MAKKQNGPSKNEKFQYSLVAKNKKEAKLHADGMRPHTKTSNSEIFEKHATVQDQINAIIAKKNENLGKCENQKRAPKGLSKAMRKIKAEIRNRGLILSKSQKETLKSEFIPPNPKGSHSSNEKEETCFWESAPHCPYPGILKKLPSTPQRCSNEQIRNALWKNLDWNVDDSDLDS